MIRREEFTFPVRANDLKTRFEVALANLPEWAKSFTTAMSGAEKVRVTYSDNDQFGVEIPAAQSYVDRH